MTHRNYHMGAKRRGTVYLLALILLLAFTSLGAALSSIGLLELRKGDNLSGGLQARMAAESGLGYMLLKLDEVRLPANTDAATLMANLAVEFESILSRSGDVGPGKITVLAQKISVPQITVGDMTFTAVIVPTPGGAGGQDCRLTVTGRHGQAQRQASLAMEMTPRPASAFNFGIASRGSIYVSGSATISGVNTGQEATVFSMSNQPVAIEAGGSAVISGDLFVTSNNTGSIMLSGGGLSIGGETDIFKIVANHVHFGVEPPEFPEIDTTPFSAMTTGFIDANTILPNQDLVLNNIRVKAGTDPTFDSNVTINGVLYIESPNKVVFSANTTINGIIVCQDDGSEDIVNKQLTFEGRVSAPGVGVLPNIAQFEAVKQQVGTILLAPGYGVTFRGTTNSINGTIAADQFSFIGNSSIDGELNGMILGLTDRPMILEGNAKLLINRENASETPAGFVHPIGLVVTGGTYRE